MKKKLLLLFVSAMLILASASVALAGPNEEPIPDGTKPTTTIMQVNP